MADCLQGICPIHPRLQLSRVDTVRRSASSLSRDFKLHPEGDRSEMSA